MTIPELPPDVINIILDFLRPDKDALMACSLASTTWRPASQYHLFHEIKLKPSDLQSFLDFADNSESNITAFVRRLIVRPSDYSRIGTIGIKFFISDVSHLMKYLQGLKSLTLSDIHWLNISDETKQLLSSPKNIKTLELRRVSFESVRQITIFICSFPMLENLYISRNERMFREFLDNVPNDAPKLPQNHPLHVHIAHMNLDLPGNVIALMEWLAAQDPCHTIELDTLRLGPIHDRDIFMKENIRKLIRMNHTLNCLQIKAPQLPYDRQDKDGELIHFITDTPFVLIHDVLQTIYATLSKSCTI